MGLFNKSKKPTKQVKDAKEARSRASNYISHEITEILTLIAGLADSGKTSVTITKPLEADTIENLKLKNFSVEKPIGGNSDYNLKIKW